MLTDEERLTVVNVVASTRVAEELDLPDIAIQLNCEANSHGIILQSPPHSAGQSYTIKFPTSNITAGTFLKVDSISGSGATATGQLSFDSSPATTGKAIAMASVFG